MNTDRSERARRASADEMWQRLICVARQVEATPFGAAQVQATAVASVVDEAAPYGFATRVAARALAQRRGGPSILEQLSLRALGLAGLAAALALAAHFSVPQSVAAADEDLFFNIEDPAALVLGGEDGGLYE